MAQGSRSAEIAKKGVIAGQETSPTLDISGNTASVSMTADVSSSPLPDEPTVPPPSPAAGQLGAPIPSASGNTASVSMTADVSSSPLPDEPTVPPPSPAAGQLGTPALGAILEITPAGIMGWLWNPRDPATVLRGILVCNGRTIGYAIADLFDEPKIRDRVAPGVPGFVAKLIAYPTGTYPISIELRTVQGNVLGPPLIINSPGQLDVLTSYLDATAYEGHVDQIKDGSLTGWAWNSRAPHDEVVVELWEGDNRLDRVTASSYREDLESAGKRGGHCAFRFDLPLSLLDERVHVLEVTIANRIKILGGGRIQFGPLSSSPLFTELSALRTQVARLTELVEQITSPYGNLQTKLIRTISERIGAVVEVQRETIQAEIAALHRVVWHHVENNPEAGQLSTVSTRHNGLTPPNSAGPKSHLCSDPPLLPVNGNEGAQGLGVP